MKPRRRTKTLPEPKLSHILHCLVEQGAQQMAIAQAILDAQTKLDASIQALTAAVQADLAAHSGSMSAADAQAVADKISASAASVDAQTASLTPAP